jgi:hypothetical protein
MGGPQMASNDTPPEYGKKYVLPPKEDKNPELVLYVAAGDSAGGPGMVYQVKGQDGQVMGKQSMEKTPTGIDMYRDHGLVVAMPDAGKIVEIDDAGKQSTIMEKDQNLPHPVKVAMPGKSDAYIAADDMADQLVMGTIAGTKTKVYQKFNPSYSSKPMSLAADNDKDVLFSSDADPGIRKFSGDQSANGDKPVLPASGGVAADHNSLRWAAAQGLHTIKVYEGQQFLKDLQLPSKYTFYKGGLMSFGPAGALCAAVQDNDNQQVWILCFDVDKNQITNSFKWTKEEMQDFTVGTRMLWDRPHSPGEDKSTY